ncbi:uncharacterized protein JCM6883_005248 [Sporobolomyces salmoneus]|uniref:uncharacterized protein n=1 Tax=Sporobolomyces salmoneus TaxID=183962 RepID=UPI003179A48D
MSLNFAPYSDPPDHPSSSTRKPLPSTSQPPVASSSSSAPSLSTYSYSYQDGAPISSLSSSSAHGNSFSSHPSSHPSSSNQAFGSSSGFNPSSSGNGSGMETTLNVRLAVLGALAWALGPFGAVGLLVGEVENDWVRYQSYQSILLCITLTLIHFLTSFILWSFVQKLLFVFDIAILAILSLRAYADADTLDRYRLPLIGTLAESWVQAE